MTLLELNDVNSFYGSSHVLHDVSLSVEEGQLTVLIGRNGAGKTTTLKSVMGLVEPRSGTVTYLGEDITNLSPHETAQRDIAYIPETRNLFPDLTVLENLRMGYLGHDRDVSFESALAPIYNYFPRLEERTEQKAGSMSGGEQQMLAIGRGLISDPDFLLVDEPTEGLMPTLVESLEDILVQINEDGVSMLLVEQNVNMALSAGDYAYVMDEGTIHEEGLADELLEDEEIISRYLAV